MSQSEITKHLIRCFTRGNKLLIFGNGGSASMAQHMAAELMGKFENERDALPAIALTTDTSFLTAWTNDRDFETLFSRQIEALGEPGDVAIGISSSGQSKNVTTGLTRARGMNLIAIDFPRRGKKTATVQEYQLKLMHNIVREVEKAFI
jgi:D-sedoheptulose 7-phosphate isomerase